MDFDMSQPCMDGECRVSSHGECNSYRGRQALHYPVSFIVMSWHMDYSKIYVDCYMVSDYTCSFFSFSTWKALNTILSLTRSVRANSNSAFFIKSILLFLLIKVTF